MKKSSIFSVFALLMLMITMVVSPPIKAQEVPYDQLVLQDATPVFQPICMVFEATGYDTYLENIVSTPLESEQVSINIQVPALQRPQKAPEIQIPISYMSIPKAKSLKLQLKSTYLPIKAPPRQLSSIGITYII